MTTIPVPASHSRFRGVGHILRFNWPRYVQGVGTLIAAILLIRCIPVPGWVSSVILIGAGLVAFWLVASVVVSYWVYDHSRLFRWDWVAALAGPSTRKLVNIHCGFDPSSHALRSLFGAGKLDVLDIFDPVEMNEPSIHRARAHNQTNAISRGADFRNLPLESHSCDPVTLLLSAHEIRRPAERARFFAEVVRVLAPGGQIIMAEHLRNLPNFLAFGPGFLHFHSRQTWLNAAERAGLELAQEVSITPFVRIFVFRRARL